ncbi:CORD and CS domain-containing protein [Histoplasma capsulatum var. duboisii H88]|uniref:CORD and CS domain-containing protein n=2 Tax=Ajellomyces capsulatus TaxID=5037 RepID=F0UCW2_AJEC8|nr:CORD and CS protein [Histoplasma capsulatum H143]EGC43388.1 CORD and CS domain-containing protein [Histoplasma capsulatum var. duboisii H88]QSS49570.1 CORD and CS domain-containing protein [Histoplasma capsulatum var. duboisii H88]
MAQKCVHKSCGKVFTDPDEVCVYHPGPPEFHEGHKGWKCCKPRVLSFDEFLAIPPCTTGKHSAVDNAPAPESKNDAPEIAPDTTPKHIPIAIGNTPTTLSAAGAHTPKPSTSPPPESESDDPSLAIEAGAACRRRGCNGKYSPCVPRDDEKCEHHPGLPIFHEGSKGWSCCKRRVLEFDEFMKIAGCKQRSRHLFIGKAKKTEEKVDNIRTDFYQTATSIMATLYLKKIDKANAKVNFTSPTTIELDLPTSDNKRFKETLILYAPIDTEKSSFQIMGTKMDLNLAKADGTSWPVLRKDDKHTGEIIQTGRAKKA